MSTSTHRKKSLFKTGPIDPHFIGESIAKHASNKQIGAHQLFLGQIRADNLEGLVVTGIDFTAYEEMADELYNDYREVLFSKYSLTCLHVYHSLGMVQVGEINLFVFVSSIHRKDAIYACAELVEWIKLSLPVFGKECFNDNTHQWKTNTLLGHG